MQDIEDVEIEVEGDLDIVDDTDTIEDVVDSLEETSASDTLKPAAGSGGTESKAVMLSTFTALLAQLGHEDLSDIFNQVQAQYGPNSDLDGDDKSAANRASIKSSGAITPDAMPTLSVKEDVAEMFAADKLSEDFKERAEVVFEAALNTRLTLETAKLEEAYEAKEAELEEAFNVALETESAKIFEEVSEKLDQYLDYSVADWVEKNQLAIDNGLRADIAEGFISGLQNLFAEHYIKVPEESFDMVAEMKAQIEDLTAKLNETLDENLELQTVVGEATKESILDEVAENLTVTQSEKLRTLSEGIEYVDNDTFKRKLEIVKENYFGTKKTSTSGLITESIDGDNETEEADFVDPAMKQYMSAITKSVNK